MRPTKLKPALAGMALALACALPPASAALAKEARAAAAPPCPQAKFHGKDAKARRQACLEAFQKQRLAREQQSREEIEAWRLELREHCAQDPRTCEARRAELDEKLQDRWRDQTGEGHAAH